MALAVVENQGFQRCQREIVAWLRKKEKRDLGPHAWEFIAACIERGEFMKEPKPCKPNL